MRHSVQQQSGLELKYVMAKIYPFRALRYDSARVNAADVLTQPYDKINPAMQERYYNLSPYNLVRIILGKRNPDMPQDNVYTRAAAYLGEWRAAGVLVPDPEPAVYAYSQLFAVPGDPSGTELDRRGFIALGKIEDYDQKIVHRHEQTLSGPKTDRLNLLRATKAHFGQIFMLYGDPEQRVEKLLFSDDVTPDIDIRDEYGVRHRLWRVSDPAIVSQVQEAMLNKKLIIADGHHRYETSLNYRNERRAAAGAECPDAPYERVMMTFVNMDAPGMLVLPTHRVVFGLDSFTLDSFLATVAPYFEVERLAPYSVAKTMNTLHEAGAKRTALAAVTSEGVVLLRVKPGAADTLMPDLSSRQRQLDVVQLHKVILEKVLGISEEAVRNQTNVRYLRDATEAIEQVRSGEANVTFLMNPVRMDQVRDIAFAGEVLPQKSTDFYPKLLTGLTVYALE
jgi:uncharacterized protein (DUF1015 family)